VATGIKFIEGSWRDVNWRPPTAIEGVFHRPGGPFQKFCVDRFAEKPCGDTLFKIAVGKYRM